MRVLGMGEKEEGEAGKCGLEGKNAYEIRSTTSVDGDQATFLKKLHLHFVS